MVEGGCVCVCVRVCVCVCVCVCDGGAARFEGSTFTPPSVHAPYPVHRSVVVRGWCGDRGRRRAAARRTGVLHRGVRRGCGEGAGSTVLQRRRDAGARLREHQRCIIGLVLPVLEYGRIFLLLFAGDYL